MNLIPAPGRTIPSRFLASLVQSLLQFGHGSPEVLVGLTHQGFR